MAQTIRHEEQQFKGLTHINDTSHCYDAHYNSYRIIHLIVFALPSLSIQWTVYVNMIRLTIPC